MVFDKKTNGIARMGQSYSGRKYALFLNLSHLTSSRAKSLVKSDPSRYEIREVGVGFMYIKTHKLD